MHRDLKNRLEHIRSDTQSFGNGSIILKSKRVRVVIDSFMRPSEPVKKEHFLTEDLNQSYDRLFNS